MKKVTSNVGEISFKYDSSITIDLGSVPVLVPNYIVDVLVERLGDNISIVGEVESTVEEVEVPEEPEIEEEVTSGEVNTDESFACETEELTEDSVESTEEVAPKATEEVEVPEEAPVAPKRTRKGANTK